MPVPSSVPQTARATEEWEKAASPTLETLNDGIGQYDPDELVMFRQTLDRHLVTSKQERDGLIDRAAPAVHLAARSQATAGGGNPDAERGGRWTLVLPRKSEEKGMNSPVSFPVYSHSPRKLPRLK